MWVRSVWRCWRCREDASVGRRGTGLDGSHLCLQCTDCVCERVVVPGSPFPLCLRLDCRTLRTLWCEGVAARRWLWSSAPPEVARFHCRENRRRDRAEDRRSPAGFNPKTQLNTIFNKWWTVSYSVWNWTPVSPNAPWPAALCFHQGLLLGCRPGAPSVLVSGLL